MSKYLPIGRPSLIERDQQQLELISSADMEGAIFADSEGHGTFTGERLFRSDPDRYRMVVSLLSEGLGLRQIATLARVSQNTVMAVRAREPGVLEAEKQMLGRQMRGATRMLVDRVIDSIAAGGIELANIRDVQAALVSAGILTDKSELLLGGATARVDVRQVDRIGDLEDLWEALPADVIDVEPGDLQPGDLLPGTGLAGETCDPKGGDLGAEDLGADPDASAPTQDKLSNGQGS